MRKKRVLSEEHKKKISRSQLGLKKVFSATAIENIRKAAAKRKGIKTGPCSDERRENIRKATIGKKKTIVAANPTWFPKGHIPQAGFEKGSVPWNKAKKMSEDFCKKCGNGNRGRRQTAEEIEKRRLSQKASSFKNRIGGRNSVRYREWIKAVIERDKVCLKCGTSKRLHAHHIVFWDQSVAKRYDVSNGIALCVSCHMKLHSIERIKIGWTPWPKGKRMSLEHRKKLSDSHKGKIPWNKKVGNITLV